MENIKIDTHKLINYTVDFATKMLTDNQEFYPFAVTINEKGDLIMIGDFDNEELPLSQGILERLEPYLDKQLDKRERRAYALTYDVRVQKDDLSEKTDAIAVKIKHVDSLDVTIYYFTYRLNSQKTVEHIDSWGEIET